MSKKVYKKNKGDNKKEVNKHTRPKKGIDITNLLLIFVILIILYVQNYFYFSTFVNNVGIHLIGYVSNLQSTNAPKNITIPLSDAKWQKFLTNGMNISIPIKKADRNRGIVEQIGSNQIIWHGPRNKKEVALTFDADMTPVMVDWLREGMVKTYDDTRVTDYLVTHKIQATFFLTGLWIQSYPKQTQELAQNSLFELENHTYSHPSMAGYCFDQPQIPQSEYPLEIEKTQQLLYQYAHVTAKYFRFPGGCYNQEDLNLVKKMGLQTVHWDVVANDGFNDNETQIIHNVLSETTNGSIIVMHIGGQPNAPETAAALPIIVQSLQKQGYTFVTVAQLLEKEQSISSIDPKKYLSSLESFQYIP